MQWRWVTSPPTSTRPTCDTATGDTATGGTAAPVGSTGHGAQTAGTGAATTTTSSAVSPDLDATIAAPVTGPASGAANVVGVGAALAALADAVDMLARAADPTAPGGAPAGAEATEVVREALGLAGRLTAIAARMVPAVEADGWWALDGARSVTSWVAAQGRVSHGQASRLVALGRAFRDDLPITAAETVAGRVPIEAAHAVAAAANTPERRAALAATADECGEGFLAAHAHELPVGQFRVLARRWAAQADPAADERGYVEAGDREFLELAQTTDGCHLAGFLTTEHGHALQAALTALTPRSPDLAGRGAARRRADALVNLTRLALDRDLTGATGTHRPQITAVVDFGTLHRALGRAPAGTGSGERVAEPDAGRGAAPGSAAAPVPDAPRGRLVPDFRERAGLPPEEAADEVRPGMAAGADLDRFAVAELVGTGPIPDHVLARLACDSTITRVVFGPQSQVLNVGRAERTYTGSRRRAVIARDEHCRFPLCDAPPALSEIHHTRHWHRDGGDTDIHTGVLLCWHHHEHVHAAGIEITRHDDGRWRFTDRHGQPLRRPG